jgi:hypothetical protein
MDSLELLREMQEARWCGINHFALYDNPTGVEWQSLLFEKIPTVLTSLADFKESFQEIDNVELAKNILTNLLYEDMAYSTKIMSLEKARIFTNNFFSLFSSQALYFSNSTWNENEYSGPDKDFELGLSSWAPLTALTFDSGIVICDNSKIGIIWFSDDD